MSRRILLFGLLHLGLTACGSAPNKSIVGDWQIETDAELKQDVVSLFLRKENGTYFPETLSYTLEPDGSLTIEKGRDRVVCCSGGIDKHFVDQRWRTHLSVERGSQIRRVLARFRPRELAPDFPFTLPKGCSWVFDSRPWAIVSFDRGKIGGSFVFQSGCDGSGSSEAKRQLQSLIAILPPVSGSAGFVEQS